MLHRVLPLLILLACVAPASVSAAEHPAEPAPEIVATLTQEQKQAIETRVKAFWTAFCLENLTDMAKLADGVVVDDIKKGIWLRDKLERVHHQTPRAIDPAAEIPEITIGTNTESSILCTQAMLSSVDTYRVTFTSTAFNGVIHVTRDDELKVVAFNDR